MILHRLLYGIALNDETVPVENSLMFATALRQHNIPTELHVFAGGAHGIGTAGELTMSSDGYGVVKECECWMDLANAWIKEYINKLNEDKKSN